MDKYKNKNLNTKLKKIKLKIDIYNIKIQNTYLLVRMTAFFLYIFIKFKLLNRQ